MPESFRLYVGTIDETSTSNTIGLLQRWLELTLVSSEQLIKSLSPRCIGGVRTASSTASMVKMTLGLGLGAGEGRTGNEEERYPATPSSTGLGDKSAQEVKVGRQAEKFCNESPSIATSVLRIFANISAPF